MAKKNIVGRGLKRLSAGLVAHNNQEKIKA